MVMVGDGSNIWLDQKNGGVFHVFVEACGVFFGCIYFFTCFFVLVSKVCRGNS